jgi:hypothetical protein
MTDNPWKKELTIEPGFDKRDPNPHKDYGVHGCTIRFKLIGEIGAVHFIAYTDWLPLNVQRERMGKEVVGSYPDVCQVVTGVQPMAVDLGYHSAKPLRDWQKDEEARDCDILPGGKCYGDGTAMGAEPVRDRLLAEGEAGVWKELGRYYFDTFVEPTDEMGFGDLMHHLMEQLGVDDKEDKAK